MKIQNESRMKLAGGIRDHTVLIDLDEMKSIDSRGMARFIEAMQEVTAHGGHFALFGIREDVRRIFQTTLLDQVFRIFSTRDEALAEQERLPVP